jgi:hypothetical protein
MVLLEASGDNSGKCHGSKSGTDETLRFFEGEVAGRVETPHFLVQLYILIGQGQVYRSWARQPKRLQSDKSASCKSFVSAQGPHRSVAFFIQPHAGTIQYVDIKHVVIDRVQDTKSATSAFEEPCVVCIVR